MFAPKKMTVLEAYAQHGSVSYGKITPTRFGRILRGDVPVGGERARVRQALMEMPGKYAFDLASELNMSYAALNQRSLDLLGEELPV